MIIDRWTFGNENNNGGNEVLSFLCSLLRSLWKFVNIINSIIIDPFFVPFTSVDNSAGGPEDGPADTEVIRDKYSSIKGPNRRHRHYRSW